MNNFEAEFKDLHRAALVLTTKMMATLDQAELDAIARTTEQGAKLTLQLAMPDCDRLELVLVELEGKRHAVCRLSKSTS